MVTLFFFFLFFFFESLMALKLQFWLDVRCLAGVARKNVVGIGKERGEIIGGSTVLSMDRVKRNIDRVCRLHDGPLMHKWYL